MLVSNCLEIRLYAFGRGRDAYELFDLTLLDDTEELTRLWLVLAESNLLGGATDALLRETGSLFARDPDRRTLTGKLERWHMLDFAGFREAIKAAFHVEIPVRERRDWEVFLAENAARVRDLTARIESAEREIDAIVYRLFDLSAEDIALLESSLSNR